jgi:hypothetical protein
LVAFDDFEGFAGLKPEFALEIALAAKGKE